VWQLCTGCITSSCSQTGGPALPRDGSINNSNSWGVCRGSQASDADGSSSSSSNSHTASSSSGSDNVFAVEQAVQDILKLHLPDAGLKVASFGSPDTTSDPDLWLRLRLAASRAAAAYNLLAAAIVQQKLGAIEWLLQRLQDKTCAGIETCLVAQQHLAWSAGLDGPSLQVPLLVLAAVAGSKVGVELGVPLSILPSSLDHTAAGSTLCIGKQ
jgi:hypothetical protein